MGITSLKNEDINVSKYLKDWEKLSFKNSILYRITMLDGQQDTQLFLPVHFRSVVLKLLHDDSGHQGVIGPDLGFDRVSFGQVLTQMSRRRLKVVAGV